MEEIDGITLVELLKETYSAGNNLQLSKKIGINAATLGNWEKSKLSKTLIKNFMKSIIKKERNTIIGTDFIDYAKHKYNRDTDSSISDFLGITQPAIVNWRKKGLTIRSIYEVLEKSKTAHTKTIVSPVIEFFPINRMESSQGKNYEILDKKKENQEALRNELNSHYGIYMFYDSRGNSIYVGKAKDQTLWKEMNFAYNRDRSSQTIKCVPHLKINRFNVEEEKKRQIKVTKVFLHDIAVYFSAYKVDIHFIDNLEAAIIRMFPNNLFNSKVEKFKGLK